MCRLRSLGNISHFESRVREPVVANDAIASTVAFIGPGPPGQVLYVGVTFTDKGPYRSEVPAISSRSLESGSLLEIAATAVTTGTRMFINSLAREKYPINYIYGFSSQGFSYFLTIQMEQINASPLQSKLVRVCQDDPDYYSYTEIPIKCYSDDHLVQAAYVAKPGEKLAAELGITIQGRDGHRWAHPIRNFELLFHLYWL